MKWTDRNGIPRRKCPTCEDFFQPRNWLRHRKACQRRARKERERAAAEWFEKFREKAKVSHPTDDK